MFFGSIVNKLGASVRRALSQYAVGANEPELALNFIDNEYITNNSTSTFASAVTHSMSSNSTMVDSDGYIKWAPHNLVDDSDDLTGLAAVSNATRTTTTLTENSSLGNHSVSATGTSLVTSGVKYTVACEAKLGSGTRYLAFRGFGEGGNGEFPVFNLSNGTIEESGSVWTDTSITDVGDGYYLCKSSVVASAAVAWILHLSEGNGNDTTDYNYTGDGSSSILFRKIRQYRSDLGGMVDNPDKTGNDADFVPTDNAVAYLPRIGHHVYNGSAWVNEGLLAESEARTNLLTYSTPDSNWNNSDSTDTVNQAIAPDGTQTATLLVDTTANANHYIGSPNATIASGAVTGSMYVKRESISYARLRLDGTSGNRRAWFDLENGTVGSVDANAIATMQDVGNGWYRLSLTEPDNTNSGTGKLQLFLNTADGETSYIGDGSGAYVWGAQLEQASTPSSFIPTDAGSSVTRAAETFTIPSANLPWPEPNYIGSELVTNGTFDTNVDNWTGVGADVGNTTFDNGTIKIFGNSAEYQAITTVVGKVYAASVEVTAASATNSNFRVGTTANGTQNIGSSGLAVGSHTFYFVATATTSYVTLKTNYAVGDTAKSTNFDNVSVREINPLSVSIAVDGRVTYTDEGGAIDVLFYNWRIDSENRIYGSISGSGTDNGLPKFFQVASNVYDNSSGPNETISEDVLNAYSFAVRHTTTEVEAAGDGVLYPKNTTPTALVDLSSTDLTLASTYMGTVGTFRIWDKDITDDGLVEATNPSLEPSLSLTFEGTGTNSFVTQDWSE